MTGPFEANAGGLVTGRRAFLLGLAGGARVTLGEQPSSVVRVGLPHSGARQSSLSEERYAAFQEGMHHLGYAGIVATGSPTYRVRQRSGPCRVARGKRLLSPSSSSRTRALN